MVDLKSPGNRYYFENEIQPFFKYKNISYIGEIGYRQKVKFLGKAKALKDQAC